MLDYNIPARAEIEFMLMELTLVKAVHALLCNGKSDDLLKWVTIMQGGCKIVHTIHRNIDCLCLQKIQKSKCFPLAFNLKSLLTCF